MTEALLEVTIILVLVIGNGLLAGAEIAVVSSRKARLHQRARDGSEAARKALDLANSPNRFLSTVQIGITAMAVVAGAFGGARVAATLEPMLIAAGVSVRFTHELAIVLVVLIITYLTLVVGELVPKRIALHDPERMAMRAAPTMQRLSRLATPLVNLLGHSTDMVLRMVPLRDHDNAEITEEEIRGMIAHATEAGVLEATEQQIVERLFRLSDQTVDQIMTHRNDLIWLDRAAGPESWRRYLQGVRHTRYVVADGDLDRYDGYIMVRELLQRLLAGEELRLDGLIREAHVLPPWTPVFRLLELFQWSGDHIALVVTDTGRVEGVVTLNDVLAGIVGDMPQVQHVVAPGIAQREDGSWLVDGLIPFREFAQIFQRRVDASGAGHERGYHDLRGREAGDHESRDHPAETRTPGHPHTADATAVDPGPVDVPTLHAFMVTSLSDPPRRTAVVRWKGLRLEIVDMDGSRVDQVLVTEESPPGDKP
jgi:putative hemolysin